MKFNFNAIATGPGGRLLSKLLLVMKLTTLIILIAFMQVSAKTYSQITLHVNNKPLTEVLETVKKQTGYVFFYEGHLLDNIDVTVNVTNVSLKETLDRCIMDLPLRYDIVKKNVIITQKTESAAEPTLQSAAIPIIVSGKVTDEAGQPIPGVTIKIKSTSQAISTDNEGRFAISVPDDKTILVFSFIGYETQELAANKITSGFNVVLKAAISSLREVTVNQGYYTRKQELNTGNISIVSGDDIHKQPVTDPLLALEGRVAGLVINQSSGTPGAYSTVRLRGQNSLANGLDPLYIVDGVPYSNTTLTSPYNTPPSLFSYSGNIPNTRPTSPPVNNGAGLSPFNNLNPSDIENIEVLKDADATAIYGSRGANGVILITTKKGKAGPMKIDADVFTGWGRVANSVQLLNTPQYLQMRHEAFRNDGVTPDPNADFDLTLWDTTRYTNWQKILIGNTAHFTNSTLSLSGGNDNTQYLLSGGYSDQGTVFPGDYGDKKASAHVSITSASTNKQFHLQFTADYVNDKNSTGSTNFTSLITLAPDAPPIYDANGNLNWAFRGGTETWGNPFANLNRPAQATTKNLVTNLNLNYELLPGLNLKTNLGYTHSDINQFSLILLSSFPPEYNTFSSLRDNSMSTGDNESWLIEPQLTYHRAVAKGVLDVLIGGTVQQNTMSSFNLDGSNFTTDLLVPNIQFASTIGGVQNFTKVYRYESMFGRVGYTYEDKYLLNVTARRDGSSRFGPGKQFGDFGAVGAGWIFSKEAFAQNNLSWLSFGKLRASYGSTGNDQLTDYKFLDTYSAIRTSYQGVSALGATQLTNPYFAWERTKKLEGGVELGFLHDRINLSVSYYRNRTDNQLVSYPLPTITGFNSIQENLHAVVQNSGLEFTLNTVNIHSKDFSWTSNLNLSIQRNKLVSFPNIQASPYAQTYEVGAPLTTRYVFHNLGVDPQTGRYIFSGQNGVTSDPQFGDEIFSRGVAPDYFGGFENVISYRGFQLDFLFQFVKQLGRNFTSSLTIPGQFYGVSNEPVSVLGRWQKTGDQANIQKFTQTYADTFNSYYAYQSSDGVLTDASFIRLKTVALSYKLTGNWIQKMHLQNAQVYLQGQNLLTITNYIGLDPETQALILPPLRMITAGVRLTLK